MRRTKIVATLGPATETAETIDAIIKAGVDVVRLNFSHGTHDEHKARVGLVRDRALACGRVVGVLGDLQGPKIRIDGFVDGKVEIEKGQAFILDTEYDSAAGTSSIVGCHYKALPEDVSAGDVLILDDGLIELKVTSIEGTQVHTEVLVGGELSNRKGINKRGGGLSAPAITDKDKADIIAAAEIGVDYLAVSFPRDAADIEYARQLMQEAGGDASIVAKIERAEALVNIDEIIHASDVIMVARGDLGVEIGDPNLPRAQKDLIARARTLNKVVITATQMMESMRFKPVPTRAEVFDVANAVLDGTDAVMLSAETASGNYPAKSVAAMASICEHAERDRNISQSKHRLHTEFGRVDESIAMAAMYLANHFKVAAIAALTESGSTALWMSRISSGLPIYALTRHEKTLRRVTLYRGVYPVFQGKDLSNSHEANKTVVEKLVSEDLVHKGDYMVITKGDVAGQGGGTNSMKVVKVGDWIAEDDDH